MTVADDGFINPAENPVAANAEIAAVLESARKPVIKVAPSDVMILPGGLPLNGQVIHQVQVQELTGEHEETLARASQLTVNPFHFINTLLECGTVRIGDEPEAATKKLLKDLLVGDRDAIILGIRKATYGDVISIPAWICEKCGNETDLEIPVNDIEMHEVNSPAEYTFEVALRKGASAKVRLANGHDQMAIYENPKLTQAERDTILLTRCVISLTDENGSKHNLAGQPSIVRKMSLPNRKTILREMGKRQPGPRYYDIKFTHQDCGEEVTVNLGIGDLFLDLA